ncbi:hypothetical protein WT27_13490 [Burkholderia territorii]|uniref:Uncharacterized protein n=1 Tax=Burkholderia territorii TaxID=1503055 RepID=A0A105V468_9BURK|nr:hypothetical protein [Burkholderia territorii]KVV40933.1 hypothetical protein WT27_13490 [Burkholderia territorii]KVX33880.1 hypothetical protein WT31_09390 [Burkholderia territorii]
MKKVTKTESLNTVERITSHWTWSFLGPLLGMSIFIGILDLECRMMGQSFATTLNAIYGGFFGGIFIVFAIGWVLLTTVVSYLNHARNTGDSQK